MNALRILSLFAGVAVLLAPPIMLTDAGTGGWSIMAVAAGLLGIVAIAAIFFYIGMNGERMIRMRSERAIGGVLLMIPILTGLFLMVNRQDSAQLIASGMLLGFSLLLFLGFVYPALEPRSRPLRRRDRQDPALALQPRHRH